MGLEDTIFIMINYKRIIVEPVIRLNKNEIFVFGSNKQGQHIGGAAHYAHEYFGAKWGVGEGITGQCYALPTMEGNESLEKAIDKFLHYAKLCSIFMPWRKFLVTKIGCGIAGYKTEYIAPLFKKALKLHNVYLPEEFYHYYF